MGNLDFTNNAGFSAYCVALLVAGLIMLVLAGIAVVQRMGTAAIISTTVAGLAGLGYALYLIFLFQGGTYYMSLYIFILPIVVVAQFVQTRPPQGWNKQAKQHQQQVKAGAAAYGQRTAGAGMARATAPAAPAPAPAMQKPGAAQTAAQGEAATQSRQSS